MLCSVQSSIIGVLCDGETPVCQHRLGARLLLRLNAPNESTCIRRDSANTHFMLSVTQMTAYSYESKSHKLQMHTLCFFSETYMHWQVWF